MRASVLLQRCTQEYHSPPREYKGYLKSALIGHLAGPLRRLEPLVAQRQEKCGPNRPTPTGYSCNNAARQPDGGLVRG